MSVLVVSPRYAPHPGGIEKLLGQVLPELRATGLDVVVATGTDEGVDTVESVGGVPVYRLPFAHAVRSGRPDRILRVAARLREIEHAHGVDARHIQGFGDTGVWYVLRAHQRRPMPLAISVHGTLESTGPIGSTGLSVLEAADVVSVVSDAVLRSVVALVPSIADRIRVIRNGLRAEPRHPSPWPANGPLLAIGRLEDDQKGFDVAIDALAVLAPTHPDLELVIVGRGQRRDALREHAARTGVEERVRIVDQLTSEQVASIMDDSSVVLVPSRAMEGFSLVALEAAHAARPVVASAVGGLAETIEDGVTGIIVEPEDPVALARGIDRFLADPGLAQSLGRTARQRALERFDLGRCVAEYRELYRALNACARRGHQVEPEPTSA